MFWDCTSGNFFVTNSAINVWKIVKYHLNKAINLYDFLFF